MRSILTSLLLGAVAFSQTVTLNVVVKDKKGAAIRGLGPSDFEVTDGGAKPAQVSVRMVDASESDPLKQKRLITIVFENLGSAERRLGKQIALDLIKESKDPHHLFAVFIISNRLSLLQPFTDDREALKAAIEVATSGAQNTRFVQVHAEMKKKVQEAAAKGDAIAKTQLAMLRNESIIDDAEGARRSIVFLDSIASGLASHPGRKAVGYLTWGLVVPTYLDVAFEALQSRANLGGVSFYGLDCRGVSQARLTDDTRTLSSSSSAPTNSGTENNTATNFFGIDNAVEGLRLNVQANFRVLSETTGGLFVGETNDPRPLLRQMLDDTTNYYELTYNPGITKYDGSVRKTTVKVPAQKDARIRDRDSYFALREEQQDLLPYEVAMMEKLTANPLPREVEFRSGTWKLRSAKDAVTAAVAVEVPLSGLQFKEDAAKGEYYARLTMLVQVKEPSGKVIQKFSRDLPLKGKLEQLTALKASNFNFREQVTAPPGRYIVEAVITDQFSGKTAARKTSLLANPPAGAVSLSSVTVVRNFQPNVKDLSADDPFQFQGGRITPTLNTNLKAVKGAQIALFFIVYPDKASGDAPQATVQYLKDGNVVGSANLQLPAAGSNDRIPYVLSSPMDAMPAGAYEIKVVVKQGSSAPAQESVFLNIES